MSIRRGSIILVLVILASTSIQAQLPIVNASSPMVIPGEYVVVFKPGTPVSEVKEVEECVKKLGGKILFRYRSALLGFSAKMPPAALDYVRSRTSVTTIEANQVVKLDSIAQINAPRGLDRTDQRLLNSSNQTKYTYTETGANVHAYVIDTGIRKTHHDFNGRASGAGFTAFDDGHGTDDCNRHGTHVAGTIGGTKYGVAKKVTLHAVRVFDCVAYGTLAGIVAGVDWVTNQRIIHKFPSVANMSLSGKTMPTLDEAVTGSIWRGVTYVVAAGNDNADACTNSPARVPGAITVGSIDPTSDTRFATSNFGRCLALFAPGVNIVSAGIGSDTDSDTLTGTSQAAPHVTGVAALYLQHHPNATPAEVWGAVGALHFNDDVSSTTGWAGVIDRGEGSPNELLHWSPLTDGHDDGGAHLTTVDGVHFNFPSAGEFVLLRGEGVEVQIRRTPVATTFDPGPDPYDGLTMCPSLDTAIAARVGSSIVTYQPSTSDDSDPSGMQLRINGKLTTPTTEGVNFDGGGRVVKSPAGDGIEVDFPDGTVVIAIPGWWGSQGTWYLNVQVGRTRVSEGVMGAITEGSWLPALPGGQSLGAMPSSLQQRFVKLNEFANAWRVTPETSLFDYAPGTSTATFTLANWPSENPPCALPNSKPVTPATPAVAQAACKGINEAKAKTDCIFDVRVTGEVGFASTHLISQRIRTSGTTTTVAGESSTSVIGLPVTFTAAVAFLASDAKGAPTGAVQFVIDGKPVGDPVKLDVNGRAKWTTLALSLDVHQIAAIYLVPAKSAELLPSSSMTEIHTVTPWWPDTPKRFDPQTTKTER